VTLIPRGLIVSTALALPSAAFAQNAQGHLESPFGIALGEIIIILFLLGACVLHLVALISVLTHEFTASNKVVWLLAVLLASVVGPILYFAIGRRHWVPAVPPATRPGP